MREILYPVIAILILWDLLASGYILTLDMISGPEYGGQFFDFVFSVSKIGADVDPIPLARFLYFCLHYFLEIFIPPWLIQKIFLFTFLIISGISMHKLVPVKTPLARYFAGFVYMINPFIYIRYLAGHFFLLWSYAILPLVVNSFMDLFENRNKKNIFKASLLLTLVIPEYHFFPITLGLLILFFLAFFFENKIENVKVLASVVLFFSILNLSWISSFILEEPLTKKIIANTTKQHLQVFTTGATYQFNVVFNAASMYGFWRGGYILPKESIPAWYLLFFFILFLALHGFLKEGNNRKKIAYPLGLATSCALILSTGVTHKELSRIFIFFYEYVPFFGGFREPQKFVALLAFAYSYFGGIAVDDFTEKAEKNRVYWGIIILALITPFIYTHSIFFAFDGQLKSVDYPSDYYEINQYLLEDENDFNLLFLPWHGYMDFKWLKNADKRLANPAETFFSKPIIRSHTTEAGVIYSTFYSPVSEYIEFLVSNGKKINNLGEFIAPLNVKYIILAKEADYSLYSFLFNQSDLKLVKETENLYLFKNRHNVAKIYSVDQINNKNWKDLIKKSKRVDSTPKRLDIIRESVNTFGDSGIDLLNYEKKSPAEYLIKDEPRREYIIFAVPYSKSWKLGERRPIKNLGITNAYEIKDSFFTIENSRYKPYFLGYIISIIFLIILIKGVFVDGAAS